MGACFMFDMAIIYGYTVILICFRDVSQINYYLNESKLRH